MDIKRNLLALPAIILLSCPVALFGATHCAEVAGNMIVGKVTLGCTSVQGSATFTASAFTGKLNVIGPLTANTSKLKEMNVTGDVTLQNSFVSGAADITGSLIATNTIFKAPIKITTQSITLNGSTIETIEIQPKNPQETAYLYLNANSVVNGNITFTSGHGVVKNNHSLLKGKIIGGSLE